MTAAMAEFACCDNGVDESVDSHSALSLGLGPGQSGHQSKGEELFTSIDHSSWRPPVKSAQRSNDRRSPAAAHDARGRLVQRLLDRAGARGRCGPKTSPDAVESDENSSRFGC